MRIVKKQIKLEHCSFFSRNCENNYNMLSKNQGQRKFYDFPPEHNLLNIKSISESDHKEKLLHYIYENIACHTASFDGPFGKRKVVYCDYTASGQPLNFIENYLKSEVMPFYGNTHTTTSVSSLQSTLFRHEAKDIIRSAVNANEHDAVLFCGTGCTSAIHKLIHCLDIKNKKVVVFVGPFEHHSNLLPWREVGALVVRINENSLGLLDLYHLEEELKIHTDRNKILIGSFNSASNITGIITDDKPITIMLHKYGALSFWDYAASAPYVTINMNPVTTGEDQEYIYKDAIFFSPHKFVGGVDSPGVLIAKKKLFRNPVPFESGGGTVFFVTRESHRYLQEVETREEGGTPSIIGAIRAGMVFQLKQSIGVAFISQREKDICWKALNCWSNISNLKILGNIQVDRLPIFSFVIQHEESGLYLHHNFVCAVLNDVFGIQSRGGCACSGPYALDLLGIDENLAVIYDSILAEDRSLDRVHLRRYKEHSDREVLRPGFSRINIPYFMDDEDIDFLIKAVAMAAEHAWKLLPQYTFNPETGEWRHKSHQVFKDRKWLGSITYKNGRLDYPRSCDDPSYSCKNFKDCLIEATSIFQKALQISHRMKLADQEKCFDEVTSKLHWFLLPSDAQTYLHEESRPLNKKLPFTVKNFHENAENNLVPRQTSSHQTVFIMDELKKCIVSERNIIVGANETSRSCKNTFLTKCNRNLCGTICLEWKSNDENSLVSSEVSSCWYSPPKTIFCDIIKAIKEFKMIQDKDRVLVCLSGGKDSLSLLHTLHQYQFYAQQKNIHFELGAMTVDPKSTSYDPSPLITYLASLKVPYFYEEQAILKQAAEVDKCKSICSFCSRMKRGRIYACARRENYNVIALGQHLDDLAESFLMSVFHNGRLRTMKASYMEKSESLKVIRPFVFVREKELRKFAEKSKLPVISENCPACFEAPKERHRVKQLLAAQEVQFPKLYSSLKAAMYPLMAIDKTGIEAKLIGLSTCKM